MLFLIFYFLPVAGFGGDDVANAAAWVRDVAGVAWDDVKMKLRNGLAGGGAVIEPDVEGVGSGRQL